MGFEDELRDRSAASFAGFLLSHLRHGDRVLDCGCGSGTISIGLADVIGDGRVVAFDIDPSLFGQAIRYVGERSADQIGFLGADGNTLPFKDATFDAAFCHSMLETLPNPGKALDQIMRVLVPRGVCGVASVDYGGLILAGPNSNVLERFYDIREHLWDIESIARSRSGRELRGLLHTAGFTDVKAGARYVAYGDVAAIRSFGEARSVECVDSWFSASALRHGLLSAAELEGMGEAWRSWSASPNSFLAFPWLHATGHKP